MVCFISLTVYPSVIIKATNEPDEEPIKEVKEIN
jgi:hypothetical protein